MLKTKYSKRLDEDVYKALVSFQSDDVNLTQYEPLVQ